MNFYRWFHGKLTKDDAERRLRNDSGEKGTYLIREIAGQGKDMTR